MSAILLAAMLVVGEPDSAAKPAADRHVEVANGGLRRSGLNGWGLGLEVPIIGVMTGLAEKSKPGWGYTIGGAVSYEVTPSILGRLTIGGGQTYGGRAPIRYIGNVQSASDPRAETKLHAEWIMIELGLGGAYLFRSVDRAWTPYAGLDASVRYGGYNFRFDDSVASLEAIDIGDPLSRCVDASCRSEIHDAIGLGFSAGLRGGIRLELASWLAAQPELQLLYTRANDELVSNTVANRDVRGAAENVLLIRATFTVRVGL